MIKGINRQIIEITDTGNLYYERALLVLRPEYSGAQRALLEREARKVLNKMNAPSTIKKKHVFFYWALRLGSAAAIGAFAALLLCNIF
ncbi:MAG TPA: hypothetical protein GX401_06180 [Clostridiales bacterium]|nr:hypothetical protein [Clostridiales bacterium]